MVLQDLEEFKDTALSALISGRRFDGLADLLARKLMFPVIITGLAYNVVGSSGLDLPDSSLLDIEKSNPEEQHCLVNLAGKLRPSWLAPIYASRGKKVGYLLILDFDRQVDAILYAQALAPFCALEFDRLEESRRLFDEHKEIFIFDLLYGNMDDPSDLIERGKLWGWNLARPHAVIVFQWQNYDRFSANDSCLPIIRESVAAGILQLQEKPLLLTKQDQVIAVLPVEKASRREKKAFLKMFVNMSQGEIERHLKSDHIRAGVGRIYESPQELFRSYQEAKVALELGYLSDPEGGTPFFTELGLERLLYNHDQQELQEFYREVLGDLEKLEPETQSEFMKILEKYFANHCDLKTTANILFLHPNTLRYRLKKMEDLLHLNLEDFDTKLNLMAALKIKHLQRF